MILLKRLVQYQVHAISLYGYGFRIVVWNRVAATETPETAKFLCCTTTKKQASRLRLFKSSFVSDGGIVPIIHIDLLMTMLA